ncbi:PREDICTED: uncharacterized protein LOC108354145 [Rhagoletis zephyria]|uniref:uncharacterized protein LOC108354145 n=1 Tax=Rhagoletis zephyria TaxID=28612 RepID=UPI0008113109|nr:PREDICTED: uncharacterized protein LOC108354145 [Rhagoletis zephyria]
METLKVVLKTQNELIEGINKINHNQTTIVQNQIQIYEVLEQVQQNAVNKSEMEAQNMMLRECKVVAKKIERSVCRMTGEISDKNLDDIASSLPLQSDCAVDLMETKLRDPEYAQAMVKNYMMECLFYILIAVHIFSKGHIYHKIKRCV